MVGNCRRVRTCLIVAVILVMPMSSGLALGADAREQTLKDWQNRLKRVRSVRYDLRGTEESKNNAVHLADSVKEAAQWGLKVIIPPDAKTPINVTVLIDLAKERFRIEESTLIFSQSQKRLIPRVRTVAYDRKALQTLVPRDMNERGRDDPDIGLSEGDLHQQTLEAYLWPVFAAHGMVPTVNGTLRPDRLPVHHELEEFELRGTIEHLGRSCVILRTEPINAHPSLADEFWVDPAREGAIARHVYFGGKNPWIRIETNHQETMHGWLPKSWTCTWTPGGLVAKIQRLTVESIEYDPRVSAGDFTLPIKPGMIVETHSYPALGSGLDPTKPSTATFRVDPSGEWAELHSKGFTTTEGVQLPYKRPRKAWWWIAGLITGAALMLAGAAWLWRRRRARGSAGALS